MSRDQIVTLNPSRSTERIAAALGYRGRKFEARVTESVTMFNTYWDGGSRSTYHAFAVDSRGNLTRRDLPRYDPPQFGGPRQPVTVEIPPNVMIVEHSIFCGKDMGLTINIRPADVPAGFLPERADLSRAEYIVLAAAESLKSSYGGRKPREDAARAAGIGPDEYAATIATLIQRGLLRKNKSITPDGSNAVRSAARPENLPHDVPRPL